MLILHYTGMATAQAALDWLCAEESQVSSHYFVDEAGLITQMVPESARAWHAGESNWKGETDNNSASIGIEIAMSAIVKTPRRIFRMRRSRGDQAVPRHHRTQRISADRVLAHSDIAPDAQAGSGRNVPLAAAA
jgi:N-acetylmuramoyl-L-alanine amidase